jgi:hypothetical protein
MAYAAHPSDLQHYHGKTLTQRLEARSGVLRRLYRAFRVHRQKEADRHIAAFIARSGGRLTDSVERELADRIFAGDWQRRPGHPGL